MTAAKEYDPPMKDAKQIFSHGKYTFVVMEDGLVYLLGVNGMSKVGIYLTPVEVEFNG